MTGRILSRQGNVIAADFQPRPSLDLTVEIKTETLYQDQFVILTRTTAGIGGRADIVIHSLGDLATGRIAQLNNKDATT